MKTKISISLPFCQNFSLFLLQKCQCAHPIISIYLLLLLQLSATPIPITKLKKQTLMQNQDKISITQQIQKIEEETVVPLNPVKVQSDFCLRMSRLRCSLILQIIRTGVYLLVAFGIFSFADRTNKITLHEQSYFSSEQVVYASQIRGLFPPVQGTVNRLLGRWTVSFTNSLEIGSNDVYRNYTVEFKLNDVLRIKRIGCQGDLTMRWQTFQYNIYVNDFKINQNEEMVIVPEEKDIICIGENTMFFNHIRNASVWTLFNDRLYILVERWNGGRNVQSILLLEKKQV